MQLQWSEAAAADIERIADYLTRELVLSPLPWILVYAVRGDAIYVVRILHGAQQWP